MAEHYEESRHEENLGQILDALERGDFGGLRSVLQGMHPADIALLLQSLPAAERDVLWEGLGDTVRAEVFAEAEDAVRTPRMLQMDSVTLAEIAREVDDDDAADILQDLPEPVLEEVLDALDAQERDRLESILAYPEDTAGGLMNLDVVTVRGDVSLEAVHRYLRRRGEIPEKTNRLFVVDRENRYRGEMRLADLVIGAPERKVADLMLTEFGGIDASTPAHEVARLFEQRNLISAPVEGPAFAGGTGIRPRFGDRAFPPARQGASDAARSCSREKGNPSDSPRAAAREPPVRLWAGPLGLRFATSSR